MQVVKPKYPRIPCELSKRTKLCGDDKKKIKKLIKQGKTQDETAQKFNVSQTRVWEIIHPKKWKMRREEKRIYNKNRYHNDPKYREKQKKSVVHHIVERSKTDPVFRKFMTNVNNYYYHKKWKFKKIKNKKLK